MHAILTPDQMRALEQRAFSQGVSSLLLMEDAARAAHQAMARILGGTAGKRILYLVGCGNNGGDGLAMARLCLADGGKPEVLLVGEPCTPDAKTNLAYAQALGIPLLKWDPDHAEGMSPPNAVVDAVFGIGFHDSLPPGVARLAEIVAGWQVPVFAVDIPSGMDGLTGEVHGAVFEATHTLALGHLKLGHCLSPHLDAMGELQLVPLAIPQSAYEALKNVQLVTALDAADLAKTLPHRPRNAHKGISGRVLLYMGSWGMAGAAGMAALACLSAGAGLLTIACEAEIIPVLQALAPNAMCLPIEQAVKSPPPFDVLAVGCGLGQGDRVWENLLVLWQPDKPSVWDADALNLLAKHQIRLGERAVMTPHPGEAARLLGCEVREVTHNPLDAARRLQEAFGATVVLKGAASVIQDASQTSLNIIGSPALAKGGSGDALAGIIAGLLAQQPHKPPFESARTACLWLGTAGQRAAGQYGVHSVLTGDVIACMKEAAVSGFPA